MEKQRTDSGETLGEDGDLENHFLSKTVIGSGEKVEHLSDDDMRIGGITHGV